MYKAINQSKKEGAMLQVPWAKFEVVISISNQVVGGIPSDPNMIKGWVEANMKKLSPEEREKVVEETKDSLKGLDPDGTNVEKMYTTFKRDTYGLYLESRCIKAALKESSNVLREILIKQEGKKAKGKAEEGKDEKKEAKKEAKSRFTNLKSKVAERIFVKGITHEDRIHFLRDGKNIEKPDSTEEMPVHVMTAQGPRTALKKFDTIKEGATMRFILRTLDDGLVDEELITVLLEYASENGLGAARSQENGKFKVESIKRLEA